MAIKITEECINCGACEPECPNQAIYEGAMKWRFADGTNLHGEIITPQGLTINADEFQQPKKDDIYFIVNDKCTECVGFHEEPQCAAVCPVDCCILDDQCIESENDLLKKKNFLHRGG